MEKIKGKSVFEGIAIGKIVEIQKREQRVSQEKLVDIAAEFDKFEAAKLRSVEQLKELYQKAVEQVGEVNAAIFEAHQMLIEDANYSDAVKNMITAQTVSAAYAVARTGENFAQMFADMDDEYMRARAADIQDVSERIITNLTSVGEAEQKLLEKSIIVADDLTPSETIKMDKKQVLAFVTRRGSINSHTAILARTMNIPAIVSAPVPAAVHGARAIVDGFSGEVILSPVEEVEQEYTKKQQAEQKKRELLHALKGKPAMTRSGKEIKLYANIGGVEDVVAALQEDAAGIGLFRSEFLYLQETDYPSEEMQLKVYRTVAEMMAGRKVIIRTLDIGADKKVRYFHLEKEENPALGCRAIRICLTREDVFRTQLRALYRASAFGNIAIMIPMISSLWEIQRVKEIAAEVRAELTEQGTAYEEVELGIMIETPAAVMIADELAREVDFFSIGTNDLTQYTLAVDRQNPALEPFFDAHHPAVLRMIRMTVDSAHRAGIWAGICGELGADLELTQTFIEMGVDELSVSPSMLLLVKKEIVDGE